MAPRCRQCGGIDFVVDQEEGDEICRRCGLVSGWQVLDGRSAYVNAVEGFDAAFGSREARAKQAKAAAAAGVGDGGGGDGLRKCPRHAEGIEACRQGGHRLKLATSICDTACALLDRLRAADKLPVRRAGSLLGGGALYHVCREAGVPRTLDEVVAAVGWCGGSKLEGKGELFRAHQALLKELHTLSAEEAAAAAAARPFHRAASVTAFTAAPSALPAPRPPAPPSSVPEEPFRVVFRHSPHCASGLPPPKPPSAPTSAPGSAVAAAAAPAPLPPSKRAVAEAAPGAGACASAWEPCREPCRDRPGVGEVDAGGGACGGASSGVKRKRPSQRPRAASPADSPADQPVAVGSSEGRPQSPSPSLHPRGSSEQPCALSDEEEFDEALDKVLGAEAQAVAAAAAKAAAEAAAEAAAVAAEEALSSAADTRTAALLELGRPCGSALVPRFASELRAPLPLKDLAVAVAKRAQAAELLGGQSPALLAAASLHLASQLFPRAGHVDLASISKACTVAPAAVKKAHRLLGPRWRVLVPRATVLLVGEATLDRLLAA